MDKIKIWLFYLRDFLVRNFMVSPKALVLNNELIYFIGIKNLLYWIFRLLPFCFVKTLLGLFNIGIIYKLDSIYNLTNIQHNHIVPIIFNFLFVNDNGNNEIRNDFTSKIKYYNASVPLYFIIKENNLKQYNKIKIKYLNKGKSLEKNINVCDFNYLPIYKLFEN